MKYLIVLLCLSGCALNPADESLRQQLQIDADARIDLYNSVRLAHFEHIPVVLESSGDASTYGEARHHTYFISIDPEICRKDMDDCLNDTIPHEEAHIIAYQAYGFIHQYRMEGHKLVLEEITAVPPHGAEWCDIFRTLGGKPEKHGYCH